MKPYLIEGNTAGNLGRKAMLFDFSGPISVILGKYRMYRNLILIVFCFLFAFSAHSQPLESRSEALSPDQREPAPDLIFYNLKKKKVRISDFRGKVVYMDVWASWCQPCFAAFPSMQILSEKFPSGNAIFLTVSTDKKRRIWKKTLRKEKIPGLNVWAGKGAPIVNALEVYTLPRYILIDKQGRIAQIQAKFPSGVESDLRALLDE
jgi:thiol-disulfide isomerase/thioredoxin